MGANAQIAVPAFTAGQVLTAEQQTQINTGIPVFATTTTRDAAFGGTGEKVLAQGQYAYIEATSSLMVYSGSQWINAVNSGLVFISTTTITATASTTIQGCFTSTYTNYRVLWEGVASADAGMVFQLATGSTPVTSTYNRQRIAANSTSISGNLGSGVSGFLVGGVQTTRPNSSSVDIFNPATANPTSYSSINTYNDLTTYMFIETGEHTSATAYDGLVVSVSAGNFTGTVSIYGYAK